MSKGNMDKKDFQLWSDSKLISEVKSGNQFVFEFLIKKYQKRIATIISGIIGNCAETADVGQETFIRFYYGVKDFRNESSILTYLTKIAINLSLNELKKRKRHFFISLFKNEEQTEEIDLIQDTDRFEESNLRELISIALRQLDLNTRMVIILRLIEGYSVKETSEILKIPLGTVLSRQARGQEKLKLILHKYL